MHQVSSNINNNAHTMGRKGVHEAMVAMSGAFISPIVGCEIYLVAKILISCSSREVAPTSPLHR